jgi:DNA-binding transcriptional ArsR family regulator
MRTFADRHVDSSVHKDIPDFDIPPAVAVEQAVEVLRILGDPTRLRILYALCQGESSVACLAELAGTTATAVSQHLARLRLARLVKPRREGTFMYYTVVSPEIRRILDIVLDPAITGKMLTPVA